MFQNSPLLKKLFFLSILLLGIKTYAFSTIDSTIVLEIIANKKDPVVFLYNGFFRERPILNTISNNSIFNIDADFPIRISVIDTVPKHVPIDPRFFSNKTENIFIVFPNEKLNVEKDISGRTRMKVLGDSVRTNELNFFVDLEKEIGLFDGFGDDLPLNLTSSERLLVVDKTYEKRIAFLNNYKKAHSLSNKFISYVEQLVQLKRLIHLVSPYYSFNTGSFKKPDSLIINKFKELIILEDNNCHIPEYRSIIQQYIYYLAQKDNLKTDISSLMKIVHNQLKGRTKEIALFDLLAFANSQNNLKSDIFSRYLQYSSDEYLQDYALKNYKPLVDAKLSGLGQDLLKSELISDNNLSNDTWSKILNSNYKVTYVDFWASWCAPCRAEMPDSQKLKNDYVKKGMNFIYISVDDNLSSWKKAIKALGLIKSTNYNLPEGLNSIIAQKFKISTIPRYILFSKNGKIINADAPRPSDPKIRKIFDDLLKE